MALYLVNLNDYQIQKAKEINGTRKKITHALVCEGYGQIFGSERHCRKYFNAWKDIFSELFNEAKEVQEYALEDYQSTFNLVNVLIAANDSK